MTGRRFIRGIPVSQIRSAENPPWICSSIEHQRRDPDSCHHGTVVKALAVEAPEAIRYKHGVPPGERAVAILENPEEGLWRFCKLCGSIRNPRKGWILLYSERRVEA